MIEKIKVYFEKQQPSKTELVLYLMTPDYKGKVDGEHLRYSRLSDNEMNALKNFNQTWLSQVIRLFIKLWFFDIGGIILLGLFGLSIQIFNKTMIQAFTHTIENILMGLLLLLVVIAFMNIVLSVVMAIKALLVFKAERSI
ncbi:hypothetical protein [Leuconostoc citreum]